MIDPPLLVGNPPDRISPVYFVALFTVEPGPAATRPPIVTTPCATTLMLPAVPSPAAAETLLPAWNVVVPPDVTVIAPACCPGNAPMLRPVEIFAPARLA